MKWQHCLAGRSAAAGLFRLPNFVAGATRKLMTLPELFQGQGDPGSLPPALWRVLPNQSPFFLLPLLGQRHSAGKMAPIFSSDAVPWLPQHRLFTYPVFLHRLDASLAQAKAFCKVCAGILLKPDSLLVAVPAFLAVSARGKQPLGIAQNCCLAQLPFSLAFCRCAVTA